MKKLDFNIPFSAFCWQDFLNCFAAVHVYLADMPHNEDYVCAEKAGRGCNVPNAIDTFVRVEVKDKDGKYGWSQYVQVKK